MMRVKCIDAKEPGIPIVEGNIYTVKTSFSEIPEWGGEAMGGYTLNEVDGRFRADRFERAA